MKPAGVLLAAVLALAAAGRPAPAVAADCANEGVWDGAEWRDMEGGRWTSAELSGRVVLLDFWATWCAPCLAEMPNLIALRERLADDRFLLLGVVLDSIEPGPLRSFLRRQGVSWPQIHEKRARAAAAERFKVEAVPVTLLVDPCGAVVARDLRGTALAAAVEGLVGVWGDDVVRAPDPRP